MSTKSDYNRFIKDSEIYIPIYSYPWWLDAVCGSENWDVWICRQDDGIVAAMPYYFENRNDYKYITKAPLTQNNGILFYYPEGTSYIRKQIIREKVINCACDFIESMNIDVYEQQFHYSFDNYLPFFWRGYKAIPRYTYVIDTVGKAEEELWNSLSSKQRKNIRKGKRNGNYSENIDKDTFYTQHEKVFTKQGLKCPFTLEQWNRLYSNAIVNDSGKIACYKDNDGNITSLIFYVWDKRSFYLLLGGSIPEYQTLETYCALIWDGILQASNRGLVFDFEGSMIMRISKAFREFGGIPREYYRIRKVFNKDIAFRELEDEYN